MLLDPLKSDFVVETVRVMDEGGARETAPASAQSLYMHARVSYRLIIQVAQRHSPAGRKD